MCCGDTPVRCAISRHDGEAVWMQRAAAINVVHDPTLVGTMGRAASLRARERGSGGDAVPLSGQIAATAKAEQGEARVRKTGDTLPQTRLAVELRLLTDAAMRYDPVAGSHHAALSKLKAMIAANPVGFRSSHVRHNMGTRRIHWIARAMMVKS
jgi:hypothetical protein